MTTDKFIKRTCIKIIVFALVAIFIVGLLNAGNTILSNQLALEQMENSDEMYVLMEVYNTSIKPTVSAGLMVAGVAIVASIGRDIYKYIKNKKENIKK